MILSQVLSELRKLADPGDKKGMARFGIETSQALGVRMPDIRRLGKKTGKNHDLALELWGSGIHEARILAALIDDPKLVTPSQMDQWVTEFNSWDVCDQVCGNLFDRTPWAFEKALEYSYRDPEFEKRAGFALMAWIAVHHKKATDHQFNEFFERIKAESYDNRNFVKKAVNWALRQIGKRNQALNSKSIELARKLQLSEAKSAKWIANDALRELESPPNPAKISRTVNHGRKFQKSEYLSVRPCLSLYRSVKPDDIPADSGFPGLTGG